MQSINSKVINKLLQLHYSSNISLQPQYSSNNLLQQHYASSPPEVGKILDTLQILTFEDELWKYCEKCEKFEQSFDLFDSAAHLEKNQIEKL